MRRLMCKSIAGTGLSFICTTLNAGFLLFIYLPKKSLVIEEFLSVHLAGLFCLFGSHLSLKECLVVLVDRLDLTLKASLLKLIIFFILGPDNCLLIVECLLACLSQSFLLHLLTQ